MEKSLWQAASDGNLPAVSELLRQTPPSPSSGPVVNWANPQHWGWSALHMSSQRGHLAVVQLLAARPDVDVNLANEWGATPFYCACWKGQTAVVLALLASPACDPNRPDRDGATPLWRASLAGHLEIVKWLLASGRVYDVGAAKHSGFDVGVSARSVAVRRQRELEEAGSLARAETYRRIADLLAESQERGAALRTRLRRDLGICGVQFVDDQLAISIPFARAEAPPLQDIAEITKLALTCLQLEELHPNIANFTSLAQLSLANNRLRTLPPSIAELTNLRELDLSENTSLDLVELLRNIRRVEKLNISKCDIVMLPPEIGQLHNLRELNVKRNKMRALPDSLLNLYRLEEFDCSHNRELELRGSLIADLVKRNRQLEIVNINECDVKLDCELLVFKALMERYADDGSLKHISMNDLSVRFANNLPVRSYQDFEDSLYEDLESTIHKSHYGLERIPDYLCNRTRMISNHITFLFQEKEFKKAMAQDDAATLQCFFDDKELVWGIFVVACGRGHKDVVLRVLEVTRDVNRCSEASGGVSPLYAACAEGRLDILEILLAVPDIQINEYGPRGWTPLQTACANGYIKVVRRLLKCPQLQIDKTTSLWPFGSTAFGVACTFRQEEVIEAMIDHIDINSNVFIACRIGNEQVLKWIVGYEKKLNTQLADWGLRSEKVIIEAYKRDPEETRRRIQRELCIPERKSSDLFTLVVFFSDDYLQLAAEASAEHPAVRFLTIARRLPMEVQMKICNLRYGSTKTFVLTKHVQRSLRKLTEICEASS